MDGPLPTIRSEYGAYLVRRKDGVIQCQLGGGRGVLWERGRKTVRSFDSVSLPATERVVYLRLGSDRRGKGDVVEGPRTIFRQAEGRPPYPYQEPTRRNRLVVLVPVPSVGRTSTTETWNRSRSWGHVLHTSERFTDGEGGWPIVQPQGSPTDFSSTRHYVVVGGLAGSQCWVYILTSVPDGRLLTPIHPRDLGVNSVVVTLRWPSSHVVEEGFERFGSTVRPLVVTRIHYWVGLCSQY